MGMKLGYIGFKSLYVFWMILGLLKIEKYAESKLSKDNVIVVAVGVAVLLAIVEVALVKSKKSLNLLLLLVFLRDF